MRKTAIAFTATIAMLIASCVPLTTVLDSVDPPMPLNEERVAKGLKEALIVGARNTASKLAMTDGYFGDEAIRVLLPEEAKVIVDNISRIPGGRKLVEDAVLNINRAAEDAAGQAAPIFVAGVRQMTIDDAFGLLNGESNAATQYLHRTTHDALFALYRPKIETSVNKALVGGISTQESWDALTGQWNRFTSSLAGRVAGFKPVKTNLAEYLTHKALEGIFLKIAEEELKIRQHAHARVTPLLQRVFGSLDNN